jgi:hypothetical protein
MQGTADMTATVPDASPWPLGLNLVADGDIPTTAIVRQVLALLVGSDSVTAAYGTGFEAALLAARPTVFSRISARSLGWVPAFIERRGGRYALFLDDNFWECEVTEELRAYYSDAFTRQTLDEFVLRSVVVIVNSSFLAERLHRRFPGSNVEVVPAHFDFSVLPERELAPRDVTMPLRIGYAGTTRGGAFDAVAEAIIALLRDRPGQVEFEFIGFVPECLRHLPGVTVFPPLPDYAKFLAFKQSRQWDVGLAPLGVDPFTQSKTNNKYREYGALGIAGIYQRAEPYLSSVESGVDGLFADSDCTSWYAAMTGLIDDVGWARRMGAEAHRRVRERHDVRRIVQKWTEILAAADLAPMEVGESDRMQWRLRALLSSLQLRLHEYRMDYKRHGKRAIIDRAVRWLRRRLRVQPRA